MWSRRTYALLAICVNTAGEHIRISEPGRFLADERDGAILGELVQPGVERAQRDLEGTRLLVALSEIEITHHLALIIGPAGVGLLRDLADVILERQTLQFTGVQHARVHTQGLINPMLSGNR